MTEQLQVLIGMHHEGYATQLGSLFERKGYTVTYASDIEQMLGRMDVEKSSSDTPVCTSFNVYVMDANLGERGVNTLEPTLRIYRYIERDVKEGLVRFLTTTATDDLLENATRAGLVCVSKSNIYNYIKQNF